MSEGLLVAISILFYLVLIAGMVFWIWMIIDCATREEDKWWLIIIIFIQFIGALIYLFIRKIPRERARKTAREIVKQ